jgi:hypothetical protein
MSVQWCDPRNRSLNAEGAENAEENSGDKAATDFHLVGDASGWLPVFQFSAFACFALFVAKSAAELRLIGGQTLQ